MADPDRKLLVASKGESDDVPYSFSSRIESSGRDGASRAAPLPEGLRRAGRPSRRSWEPGGTQPVSPCRRARVLMLPPSIRRSEISSRASAAAISSSTRLV